jgi:hypothetical protein
VALSSGRWRSPAAATNSTEAGGRARPARQGEAGARATTATACPSLGERRGGRQRAADSEGGVDGDGAGRARGDGQAVERSGSSERVASVNP